MGGKTVGGRARNGEGSYTLLPSGNWRYRVFVEGKSCSATGKTQRQALVRCHEKIERVASGETAPDAPDSCGTLYAETKAWIERRGTELSPTTAHSYGARAEGLLQYSTVGQKPLDKVTERDLRAFFASLDDGSLNRAKAAELERQIEALDPNSPYHVPVRRLLRLKMPKRHTMDGPLGNTIKRQTHSLLNSVYTTAMLDRRVPMNPLQSIARAPAETVEQRDFRLGRSPEGRKPVNREILEHHDMLAILAAASTDEDRLYARWAVGLFLGLRPAEVLALEWRDFELPEAGLGRLSVRQQIQRTDGSLTPLPRTKSGTSREILVPEFLVQILLRHKRKQRAERRSGEWNEWWQGKGTSRRAVDLVFHRPDGRPYSHELDTNRWKSLLVRSGVSNVRRYVARHTAASDPLGQGGNLAAVSAMLGHSSTAVTAQVYTHPTASASEALAALQQAKFDGIQRQITASRDAPVTFDEEWFFGDDEPLEDAPA